MKDFILKFRASRYFLYGLGMFVIVWMAMHFLLQWFDPELGEYNSILSTEASFMVSVLLELQLNNDKKIQELLQMQLELLKKLTAISEENLKTAEETQDDVEEILHMKQ